MPRVAINPTITKALEDIYSAVKETVTPKYPKYYYFVDYQNKVSEVAEDKLPEFMEKNKKLLDEGKMVRGYVVPVSDKSIQVVSPRKLNEIKERFPDAPVHEYLEQPLSQGKRKVGLGRMILEATGADIAKKPKEALPVDTGIGSIIWQTGKEAIEGLTYGTGIGRALAFLPGVGIKALSGVAGILALPFGFEASGKAITKTEELLLHKGLEKIPIVGHPVSVVGESVNKIFETVSVAAGTATKSLLKQTGKVKPELADTLGDVVGSAIWDLLILKGGIEAYKTARKIGELKKQVKEATETATKDVMNERPEILKGMGEEAIKEYETRKERVRKEKAEQREKIIQAEEGIPETSPEIKTITDNIVSRATEYMNNPELLESAKKWHDEFSEAQRKKARLEYLDNQLKELDTIAQERGIYTPSIVSIESEIARYKKDLLPDKKVKALEKKEQSGKKMTKTETEALERHRTATEQIDTLQKQLREAQEREKREKEKAIVTAEPAKPTEPVLEETKQLIERAKNPLVQALDLYRKGIPWDRIKQVYPEVTTVDEAIIRKLDPKETAVQMVDEGKPLIEVVRGYRARAVEEIEKKIKEQKPEPVTEPVPEPTPAPEPEPTPTPTPTPEPSKVKIQTVTPTEKKVTSPEGEIKAKTKEMGVKEQKEYLVRMVNEAYRTALENEPKENVPKVIFAIPDDGEFIIPHTKRHLTLFKRKIDKIFREIPEPSTKTKTTEKPAKKRIDFFTKPMTDFSSGAYYNPFKPRRKEPIIHEAEGKMLYTQDGFFSDGIYAIKIPEDEVNKVSKKLNKTVKNIDRKISDLVSREGYEEVAFAGELSTDSLPPTVHLMNKSGNIERFIPADYVDSILTRYPDAKMFISPDNKAPVMFKRGDEVVGVAIRINIDPKDIFNDPKDSFSSYLNRRKNELFQAKLEQTLKPESEPEQTPKATEPEQIPQRPPEAPKTTEKVTPKATKRVTKEEATEPPPEPTPIIPPNMTFKDYVEQYHNRTISSLSQSERARLIKEFNEAKLGAEEYAREMKRTSERMRKEAKEAETPPNPDELDKIERAVRRTKKTIKKEGQRGSFSFAPIQSLNEQLKQANIRMTDEPEAYRYMKHISPRTSEYDFWTNPAHEFPRYAKDWWKFARFWWTSLETIKDKFPDKKGPADLMVAMEDFNREIKVNTFNKYYKVRMGFPEESRKKVDTAFEKLRIEGRKGVVDDQELATRFKMSKEEIQLFRNLKEAHNEFVDEYMRNILIQHHRIPDPDYSIPTNTIEARILVKRMIEEGADPVSLRRAKQILKIHEMCDDFKNRYYIPFDRNGRYFVSVTDKTGKLYYGMDDSKRYISQLALELRKEFPNADISIGEAYKAVLMSHNDLPPSILARMKLIIDELKKEGALPETLLDIDTELNNITAKWGVRFPTHFLKAENIRGWSTDYDKTLARFFTSLASWASRMKYEPLIREAIGKLDPVKDAPLIEYYNRLHKYSKYNSNYYHGISRVMFMYYLAGNPRSMIINATQPFTMTLPYSTKFVNESQAIKIFAQATGDVYRYLSKEKKSQLPKELLDILDTLTKKGEISAQAMEAYMVAMGGTNSKALKILGAGFSAVERANRIHAGIMAYRIGKIKGLSGDPLVEFARKFMADTQFEYGRIYRPLIAQTPITVPIFIFRTYAYNWVRVMKNLLQEGNYKTFMYMLTPLLVLGGINGLPFAKELLNSISNVSGYNLELEMRKNGDDELTDMFLYGVPAMFGFSIGKALNPLEVPEVGRQGLLGSVATAVLGVSANFAQRAERSYKMMTQYGDIHRAVENLMPEFMRNVAVAIRWYKEQGAKMPAGEMVYTPNVRDIVLRSLGLQPAGYVKGLERYEAIKELEDRVKSESARVNLNLAKAIVKMMQGDKQGEEMFFNIMENIMAKNLKYAESGETYKMIIPNDRSIKLNILKMTNPEAYNLVKARKLARPRVMEIEQAYNVRESEILTDEGEDEQ